MKDTNTYYTTLSHEYDQQRSNAYFRFIESIELECLTKVLQSDHKRILEIGCGTGIFLEHLSGKNIEMHGLDYNLSMLGYSQGKLKDRTYLVNGDAQKLPYPDQYFDLIYSFKALPHVQNLTMAMSEIHRILRPNGIALLEFYNKFSLKCLINKNEYFHHWQTPREITHLVKNAGFTITDITGVRIITPFAALHNIPVIKSVLQFSERVISKSSLKNLAGYYIVVCRSTHEAK